MLTEQGNRVCVVAVGVVLSGVSCIALGQPLEEVISADHASLVDLTRIQGGGFARHHGYGSRADRVVYQMGAPLDTGGQFLASAPVVYDDVTFANPCPTCADQSLSLNAISWGVITPSQPPALGTHIFTRISFYPNHDSGVTPTSLAYYGTPVVAVLDWGAGWMPDPGPGPVMYFRAPIEFQQVFAVLSTANVFDGGPGDRSAGVKIEIFHDAALTMRSTEYATARRVGFTSFLAGSSDTFGWFSANGSGEVMNSERSGGGALGTNNARGTYMGFGATGLSVCGSSDFDGDGDFGTDADIEAFFACLAGNCCTTCFAGGPDFNGDGDSGTDADIEAFFRVLVGGPC